MPKPKPLCWMLLVAIFCASAHAQVYWDAYLPQQVFTTDEQPYLSVAGVGSHSLQVRLYSVDENRLPRHHLYGVAPQMFRGKLVGSVRQVKLGYSGRQQVYRVRDVQLPKLAPGIYVVEVSDQRGSVRANLLWVSNIGVVVKRGLPGYCVAWVVRLKDGKSIAGAKVAIYRGGDKAVAEAVTTSEGLARLPTPFQEVAMIWAKWGEHRAAAYLPLMEETPYLHYLFTERPVYRPGQTVYFKGIVRERGEVGYRIPEFDQVQVTLMNPDYVPLAEKTVPISVTGTFYGAFQLPEVAPLGTYSFRLSYHQREQEQPVNVEYAGSFEVQEYRKPEFRLKLEPAQRVYLRGEKIVFNLQAEYYFGAPVAGARVRYYLYRQYLWIDQYEEADLYELLYDEQEQRVYGGYGDLLLQGETSTDRDGRALIRVDAGSHADPSRYVLEVEVTDLSGRSEEASAAVEVYPASIHLSWRTEEGWLEPGQKANFVVLARHPRTGQPQRTAVKVAAYRIRWIARSAAVYSRQETPLWSRFVQTDAQGRAQVAFSANQEGEYLLRASTSDSQGRQATSEYSIGVYALGYRSEEPTSQHTIHLSLDRRTYQPGQRARVLVRSSLPEAQMWLTVEGRQIFASQMISLRRGVTVVDLPVTWQMVPNAYVYAAIVREKTLIRFERLLRVTPTGKILQVEVLPDKSRYQPGEEATYTIRTVDETGRPVSAEVAVGVVDEALYTIASASATDLRRFFWGAAPNKVATAISFGRQYAAGTAKEQVRQALDVDIRRRFEDLAFWHPAIITDSQGEAKVRFRMPDNLTEWRATAYAVTADTAVGVGRASAKTFKPLLVRLQTPRFLTQGDRCVVTGVVQNYTTTPLEVTVQLRVEGSAQVEGVALRRVTIPPQGQVGLDWTVKTEAIGSATFTFTATAEGYSDGVEFSIPAYARGATQVFASAFVVERAVEKSFRLPTDPRKGGVSLRIGVAPSWFGIVAGSIQALANYPYGCVEQVAHRMLAALGFLQTLEVLGVREGDTVTVARRMVEEGVLRLQNMQQIDGAWGYTEHTPPNALWTAIALEALYQARRTGFSVSPQRLQQGANALLSLISRIPSQPPMQGLRSQSQQELLLAQWHNQLNEKAHALATATLLSPQWARAPLQRLFERRSYLDTSSQCALWLGLRRAGLQPLAEQVRRELLSRAIQTPTTVFWREAHSPQSRLSAWRWYAQDTYATAWMARLLASDSPRSPLLPKALRWLAEKRQGGYWFSTNDTAQAVLAMAEYVRQLPDAVRQPHRVRLLINGELVDEIVYQPEEWLSPERLLQIPLHKLRMGVNTLRLEHSGEGSIAASVVLQYVSQQPLQQAQGLRIERVYLKRILRPLKPSERERLRRRYGDDSALLWEARSAKDGLLPGDQLLVKLTIHSSTDLYYVAIEDPKPAGFEFLPAPSERYEWLYWYARREVRDDRITFLSVRIPKGKSVIYYVLRAERSGEFLARPVRAVGMYLPEFNSSSGVNSVRVKGR